MQDSLRQNYAGAGNSANSLTTINMFRAFEYFPNNEQAWKACVFAPILEKMLSGNNGGLNLWDIGCGKGGPLSEIVKYIDRKTTKLSGLSIHISDLIDENITTTSKILREFGLHPDQINAQTGSIFEQNHPQAIDLILAKEVICWFHSIDQLHTFFDIAFSALKPDGSLVLEFPTTKNIGFVGPLGRDHPLFNSSGVQHKVTSIGDNMIFSDPFGIQDIAATHGFNLITQRPIENSVYPVVSNDPNWDQSQGLENHIMRFQRNDCKAEFHLMVDV